MKQINKLIQIFEVPRLILELTGMVRTRTCVYNWIKDGRINCGGQRIKLKTVRSLGHLYTTQEWVEYFIGRLEQ